jgi:pimeloyl-ACP methyl ester carboxylesterase
MPSSLTRMKTWLALLIALQAMAPGCARMKMMRAGSELGLAPFSYTTPSERAHTLMYYKGGDATAPRIIYVHGTPGSAFGWGDYLLNPVEGHEAVAMDRLGFRDSEQARAVPSLTEQAKAIAPLLVKRDGQWSILVGHSLGGPIVAQIAADYPDKVAALVIVAGALDPSLERVYPIQRIVNIFPLSLLLPKHLRTANRELIPLEHELEMLDEKLDKITCPVVIIHGTADELVPYKNVEYMVNRFVNASSVVVMTIEGADHCLPWKHETEVRQAIARAVELAGGVSAAD